MAKKRRGNNEHDLIMDALRQLAEIEAPFGPPRGRDRGHREPSTNATLTRPMSMTELAKLTATGDSRGERFYKKYVETGVIAARRVEGKKRVWVFDAVELQRTFPSLDVDQVLPR